MSFSPWFIPLLVVMFSACTEGLRCYACFGTGGENECEKFKTYEDAMDGKRNEIKKNCSSPHNNICYTETYAILGNTVSHIRDCNIGNTFSFNASLAVGAYERLYDLQTNNETSCVWDGQHLVCLSKCDTNFCNGPQLEEKTSGFELKRIPFTVLLLAEVLAYVIVKM